MLDFGIRPATASDEEEIKALIRASGINPLGLHWPRFLVALDAGGTLAGCGQVKEHGDGSRELASIAVVEERRGQGVAGGIIRALQARQNAPLWLTCMDGLAPFYERFGFTRVSEREAMPPYFRRAARFFNLYLALTGGQGRLAVMVWSPPDQD